MSTDHAEQHTTDLLEARARAARTAWTGGFDEWDHLEEGRKQDWRNAVTAAIALAETDTSSLRRTDPFREEDAE